MHKKGLNIRLGASVGGFQTAPFALYGVLSTGVGERHTRKKMAAQR